MVFTKVYLTNLHGTIIEQTHIQISVCFLLLCTVILMLTFLCFIDLRSSGMARGLQTKTEIKMSTRRNMAVDRIEIVSINYLN